jgi:hypothetical protein
MHRACHARAQSKSLLLNALRRTRGPGRNRLAARWNGPFGTNCRAEAAGSAAARAGLASVRAGRTRGGRLRDPAAYTLRAPRNCARVSCYAAGSLRHPPSRAALPRISRNRFRVPGAVPFANLVAPERADACRHAPGRTHRALRAGAHHPDAWWDARSGGRPERPCGVARDSRAVARGSQRVSRRVAQAPSARAAHARRSMRSRIAASEIVPARLLSRGRVAARAAA